MNDQGQKMQSQRAGKSKAAMMGAIHGALNSKVVVVATADRSRTMDDLFEELSKMPVNYYANDSEIVFEGRGAIVVNNMGDRA
jgi:hypothetical protein